MNSAEWHHSQIGEVVTHKKGYAFKSNLFTKAGGRRVIRVSDTNSSSIKNDDPIYMSEDLASEYSNHQLQSGDIILSTVGSRPPMYDSMVGKAIQVPESVSGALLNQNLVKLSPKKDKLNSDFLYAHLKTKKFIYHIESCCRGNANQASITLDDIFAFRFPLPPLPEQRKIAEILSCWDKAIEQTEKLIEAKTKLKKGLMQRLLSNRHQGGYKNLAKLGEIVDINPKPKSGIPDEQMVAFVPMSEVAEDGHLIKQSPRPYGEVKKGFTRFEEGDILVAKITPCFENGKGALLGELIGGVGAGSTEFHVIRVKAPNDPRFVYYLTRTHHFRKKGESNMTGSAGQRRVPTDFLRTYHVNVPNSEKQREIADLLETVDTEIRILSNQKRKIAEQKKGLMQQLLTGKKRVKV